MIRRGKLRHVGYITNDLDKSVNMFKKFFDLTDEDVRLMSADDTGGAGAFAFVKIGGTELELIQPMSDFFREMTGDPPPGINHIAFQVKDVEAEVKALEEKEYTWDTLPRMESLTQAKPSLPTLTPMIQTAFS